MSTVIAAKLISVVVIFTGSLLCGLLPAFRVFSLISRFYISLILSYGGGILIATSLVHILPEAREGWPDIPVSAEMSLCVGIFLVYFIEEMAHYLVCHDLHSLSHGGIDDEHNHGVHVRHEVPPNRCDEPAAVYLFADENNRGGNCDHSHNNHSSLSNDGCSERQVKFFPAEPVGEPKTNAGDCIDSKEDKKNVINKLRSLVGLIALSAHAGLEGLSIGLGKDASDVLYLCAAIAAHKLVIAFCLGMEVKNASTSSCTSVTTSSSASFKFRYMLFFALMTPLGIVIGLAVSEVVKSPVAETESTVVAVLQTLAGGTLLYVAFFEVILRERARFSGKGLMQLFFVVLGFLTMVCVDLFIGGHNHSHGHCPDHVREGLINQHFHNGSPDQLHLHEQEHSSH